MTSPDAIAAVSAVLRSRITAFLNTSGAAASVGNVSVTALPPDRLATGQQEKNQINLFLHRVSHNPGWSNLNLPSRDSAGSRVSAPPLALDLHYLLSAYGQELFAGEMLLGHALMALHEEPILGRDTIRAALAPNPADPSIPTVLATSRLADQAEQVRITPANLDAEEVARLWAAFTVPMRPSAFFQASVVLIDDDRPFAAALPVREVLSAAADLAGPRVDTVVADGPDGTPITSGSTLIVVGSGLGAAGTRIRLGSSVGTPAEVADDRISVPLGSFVPPVRAGLVGLVVARDIPLGDPATAHEAVGSTAVAVAVRPTVAFAAGAVAVMSNRLIDGMPVVSGTIAATLDPAVAADQQVTLLLLETGAPPDRARRAAVLKAPERNGVVSPAVDTSSVNFGFADVPKGDYTARVRVDGVDSPLALGGGGVYSEPKVTF